jgi:hypothetical protein
MAAVIAGGRGASSNVMNELRLPMPRTASLRAALLLAGCAFIASPVQASPLEELVQLAVHPDVPDLIVARYENGGDGLLVSRDGGRTFQLVCAALVDAAEVDRKSPVSVAGDGSIFVRSYDGLWRDDRAGCAFQRESVFAGRWVTDMVLDPADSRRMYAVTSGVEGTTLHGIYVRGADGLWSVVGSHEPKIVIQRLHVAARQDGGTLFYETIGRVPPNGDAAALQYFVRSSEDGAHWDEQPLSGGNEVPVLELVDRKNPDRLLFAQARQGKPWQLSVSSDRGKTLKPYLEVTHFTGATQAPDGRIWIGDGGDPEKVGTPRGIWHAKSLGEAPRLVAPEPTSCLAYHQKNDTLLACRRSELGELSTDQHRYLSKVSFNGVHTLVDCEGVDAVAACAEQLCSGYCGETHYPDSALCQELHHVAECTHAMPAPDAGTSEPDAGVPEPGELPEKKRGGRCTIAHAGLPGTHEGLLWLLGFAAVLLCRRRVRAVAATGLALAACGSEPAEDAAYDAGSDASSAQAPLRCGDDVPPFALPMSAPGGEGKLSAALLAATPAPPEKYLNDWTLELRDAQGKPVSDATITMARPFMPAHGHDGTFAPTVSAGDGPGRFEVKKLNLWMRGPWEVQLSVSSPSLGDDYIVFQVCIEE